MVFYGPVQGAALVNSPDGSVLYYCLSPLFVNKACDTYSCFNFSLKRCFLNIYKKHVSQKRRKLEKISLFQQRKCFKSQHQKNSPLTPPICLNENHCILMLVEGDFLTSFKLVPVVLTLESVGKCSYVSYCKTVFLCELIIEGFVLEIKVSNPKSLLELTEENQKEHSIFQKAQPLQKEPGNSHLTRKSFHLFFESCVGLKCC